ncbi:MULTISPECIES: hypothetical protein [unclassified Lacrimispora]|uniref:hypothetical protein n=1 Tax=unclassified Lacrimispora TaxID=2719232 RepID=UPI0037701AC1
MYDIYVKEIKLTEDEISILKEVLEERQDRRVSLGEMITIETLLEKLDEVF